jgi:hypothetical protein
MAPQTGFLLAGVGDTLAAFGLTFVSEPVERARYQFRQWRHAKSMDRRIIMDQNPSWTTQ